MLLVPLRRKKRMGSVGEEHDQKTFFTTGKTVLNDSHYLNLRNQNYHASIVKGFRDLSDG